MRLTDSSGGDFEQAPTGSQVGRCIRIIDLGTQQGEWQGKIHYKRQGIFMWELPNALMSEGEFSGKPFVVSKFYTLSLSEKANLRKDLAAWRGRDFTPQELAGFDPKAIIGAPCLLGITESDKGKSRVTTVMQLPKGMPVPDQINESVYFSLEDFDQKVFDNLSKGIKAMIEKSPEYQHLMARSNGYEPPVSNTHGLAEMEDDIPGW